MNNNQGFSETITRSRQTQQTQQQQTNTRRTAPICPAVYKVGKRMNTANYIPSQLPNITSQPKPKTPAQAKTK